MIQAKRVRTLNAPEDVLSALSSQLPNYRAVTARRTVSYHTGKSQDVCNTTRSVTKVCKKMILLRKQNGIFKTPDIQKTLVLQQ